MLEVLVFTQANQKVVLFLQTLPATKSRQLNPTGHFPREINTHILGNDFGSPKLAKLAALSPRLGGTFDSPRGFRGPDFQDRLEAEEPTSFVGGEALMNPLILANWA